MGTADRLNPWKSTLFNRIGAGLLFFALLHGFVGLWIDGTQLDPNKFKVFLVPVSAVVSAVSIWVVARQSGLVSVRSGLIGNWFIVLIFLLLGPICVYVSAATYNMVLDGRQSALHTVVDIGQYPRTGRGNSVTYFVSIRDEDDPQKREADIRVSEMLYGSVHPGEKLRVMYHKGAFGFPWLSNLTSSDSSLSK